MKGVVIGGSTGSLGVVLNLLPQVAPEITVPLIIVLHRKGDAGTSLEDLIASKTVLTVERVEDKTPLEPGKVFVAPSDYHLLVEKEYILSLDSSEKVLFSRPSIDVTFQSAAHCFGTNLLGILLSGANRDGADGLSAIKAAGGMVAIQDPLNAANAVMPQAALEQIRPDFVFKDKDIAPLIHYWSGLTSHR